MSKVVLVTGASSGIGNAIAEYLGKRGHRVYGASRSSVESRHFTSVRMDVTKAEEIDNIISKIFISEGKIDAVVNNAGLGVAGPFETSNLEEIRKAMETNFYGTIKVCQTVLPFMRKQKDGYIINISSIGSVMGLPYRGFYSASKASVDIMTEALRMEVKGFGIKVCLVHPGDVKTAINDHRLIAAKDSDDAYGETFTRIYEEMNKDVRKGIKPEKFGPVIGKIIHSENVKRNYYVGHFTQKLSVKLKKLLPDFLFEKMIMSYYKL